MQCEPPGDLASIQELYDAGARSIGIHVESLDDAVRLRWMPGKGSVPMSEYRAAWAEAVRVFGRNQVSTYLLIGLGEDPDELVAGGEELIGMGVYPFVVPYRPLAGTLARTSTRCPPRRTAVVYDVTRRVAAALRDGRDARRRPGGRLRRLRRVLRARRLRRRGQRAGGSLMTSVFDDIILAGATRVPAPEKFQIAPVRNAAGRAAYRRLRRDVFVAEQGLFAGTDRDDVDDDPRTVVLLARGPAGRTPARCSAVSGCTR